MYADFYLHLFTKILNPLIFFSVDDKQAFLEAYQKISGVYMSNLDFAEEVFESYHMSYEIVEPLYEGTSKAIEAMAQKMKGKE